MTIFLFSALAALVAGLNPRFSQFKDNAGAFFGGWLIRFFVMLALIWPFSYFWIQPELVGPFPGIAFVAVVGLTANLLVTGMLGEVSSSYRTSRDSSIGGGILVCVLLWAWAVTSWVGGSGIVQADMLKAQIGKIESVQLSPTLSPTDPRHMRFISREQAIFWMSKLMGQPVPGRPDSVLGSSFSIDEDGLTIQKVNGRLVWVAPLSFNSFWRWQAENGVTPFYLRMAAESQDARAELVPIQGGMRFSPTSKWGHQLERHLRSSGYVNVRLRDYSFEIDDNGRPFWVVSVLRPRSFGAGNRVDSVLVIDPSTGKFDEYPLRKMPEWIDRAIPAETALEWADNWGQYQQGFWNSVVGRQDVLEPVGGPIEIFGDDGKIYWHIGLTSANKQTDDLSAFLHIDTRSGAARLYRLGGQAAAHSSSAVNTAQTELKNSQMLDARPTEPIPYIIGGRLVYVFPAIGSNSLFQRLCMVDAVNPAIAALGATAEEALQNFRSRLAAGSGSTEMATQASKQLSVTGTIRRIGTETAAGNTVWIVLLNEEPSKLFRGPRARGAMLPVSQEGDQVKIGFADSGSATAEILSFENLSLTRRPNPTTR